MFKLPTRRFHWPIVVALCYYCVFLFDRSNVHSLNFSCSVLESNKSVQHGIEGIDHTDVRRVHELGIVSGGREDHKRIFFVTACCVELYSSTHEMYYLQNYINALLQDRNALTITCVGGTLKDMSEISAKFEGFENLEVSVLLPSYINQFPKYGSPELKASSALLDYLIEQQTSKEIDIMVFHDIGGIGTAPIQSKRSGMEFHEVVMVTMSFGSTLAKTSIPSVMFDHNSYIAAAMEDYTRSFADFSTYTTKFHYDEARSKSVYAHTQIPAKSVLSPLFNLGGPGPKTKSSIIATKTFCVFSHLHPLKAFQNISTVFSELIVLNADIATNLELVVLDIMLERKYTSYYDYLVEKLGARMIIRSVNGITMEGALRVISTSEMIVLLPISTGSRIQELHLLLDMGIPVIYAGGDGLNELSTDWRTLYKSGIEGLKTKLIQSIEAGIVVESLSVSSKNAKDEFLNTIRLVPTSVSLLENWTVCDDVTFAIVTFNRTMEVSRLLRHLKKQTCSGFKVLLYYNGECENSCQSREMDFELVQKELQHAGITLDFLFPREGHEVYITTARNAIIERAETKYLVLFDDDDVPKPDFILALRRAAVLEDADAVSSYCLNVDSQSNVDEDPPRVNKMSLSAGNTGSVGNFFLHYSGKANLLLRTAFVRAIGGCIPEDLHLDSPFVDWGLYTNIILNEGRIALVPFGMYFYQQRSKGSIYYGSEGNKDKIYFAHLKMTKFYCKHFKVDDTICELIWHLRQHSARPSIY